MKVEESSVRTWSSKTKSESKPKRSEHERGVCMGQDIFRMEGQNDENGLWLNE